MNLRQLRQFVTLAETGNFHKAAEQLHMAQPPLSVSIRKLEEEMGELLFERSSVGVFLTIAGKAMLADARLALFYAAQCQQAVTDAKHGQGGLLRIGFIGTATYALLPELIPSLRARHPKIDLDLFEATSSEILAGLVSRRFDVGLLRYPVLEQNPCEITPLDRDDFVLAVSTHSPLAGVDDIALSQAAHEPFIMYPQEKVPNLSAMAMMRCHFSGFVPHVAQEAMQVQTIMSLVASGLGVALVAGVARHMIPRGVKCLTLTDNPPDFRIGIALARLRDNRSRLVERFTEHALSLTTRDSHLCKTDIT
jgi:DNA-binding transcriptional LysR family regulator